MIKTLTSLLKQDKEKFVVPKGVQDAIPVKAIYDDGIFKVGKDMFFLCVGSFGNEFGSRMSVSGIVQLVLNGLKKEFGGACVLVVVKCRSV